MCISNDFCQVLLRRSKISSILLSTVIECVYEKKIAITLLFAVITYAYEDLLFFAVKSIKYGGDNNEN